MTKPLAWTLRLLLGVVVAAPVQAHPFHTSYAEADYRPASGKLEIALRLFADDVETALSRGAGRKVSLTQTPAAEFDALLSTYVRSAFTVKSSDGKLASLAWVGRESTDAGQHLWVYLECPMSGGATRARLSHRVLRETFSDQINSVRVRDHSATPPRQITLLFTTDAEQIVTFGP